MICATAKTVFPYRAFWITILVNAVWINASEIFRYFVFVMPMMRDTYPELVNIAPMNFPVFMVWGVWDTILIFAVTGFTWLFLDRFGSGVRQALAAGTLIWVTVFVILWLGLFNMNIATKEILAIALPLSWLEMVVAALVVNWGAIGYIANALD